MLHVRATLLLLAICVLPLAWGQNTTQPQATSAPASTATVTPPSPTTVLPTAVPNATTPPTTTAIPQQWQAAATIQFTFATEAAIGKTAQQISSDISSALTALFETEGGNAGPSFVSIVLGVSHTRGSRRSRNRYLLDHPGEGSHIYYATAVASATQRAALDPVLDIDRAALASAVGGTVGATPDADFVQGWDTAETSVANRGNNFVLRFNFEVLERHLTVANAVRRIVAAAIQRHANAVLASTSHFELVTHMQVDFGLSDPAVGQKTNRVKVALLMVAGLIGVPSPLRIDDALVAQQEGAIQAVGEYSAARLTRRRGASSRSGPPASSFMRVLQQNATTTPPATAAPTTAPAATSAQAANVTTSPAATASPESFRYRISGSILLPNPAAAALAKISFDRSLLARRLRSLQQGAAGVSLAAALQAATDTPVSTSSIVNRGSALAPAGSAESSLSAGAIAGIVIASIIVIAVIGGIAYAWMNSKWCFSGGSASRRSDRGGFGGSYGNTNFGNLNTPYGNQTYGNAGGTFLPQQGAGDRAQAYVAGGDTFDDSMEMAMQQYAPAANATGRQPAGTLREQYGAGAYDPSATFGNYGQR